MLQIASLRLYGNVRMEVKKRTNPDRHKDANLLPLNALCVQQYAYVFMLCARGHIRTLCARAYAQLYINKILMRMRGTLCAVCVYVGLLCTLIQRYSTIHHIMCTYTPRDVCDIVVHHTLPGCAIKMNILIGFWRVKWRGSQRFKS